VDEAQVGPAALEAIDGALTAVGGAVVDDPEHPAGGGVGLLHHHLPLNARRPPSTSGSTGPRLRNGSPRADETRPCGRRRRAARGALGEATSGEWPDPNEPSRHVSRWHVRPDRSLVAQAGTQSAPFRCGRSPSPPATPQLRGGGDVHVCGSARSAREAPDVMPLNHRQATHGASPSTLRAPRPA
jgi:hypothetical protein